MKTIHIYFLCFIAFVALLFIFTHASNNKLKKKHVVVCGEIKSIKSKRNGFLINYSFIYKGERRNNNWACDPDIRKKFEFGLRKILVVLDPDRPIESRPLQSLDDFSDYGITHNDTSNLNCLTF